MERYTGEMLLGPPKSKAGRRIAGIPAAIVPALREHLAIFAKAPTKVITDAIDTHVLGEHARRSDGDDGAADLLVPVG